MDIGREELSHLEIVGTFARLHLKPLKSVREVAEIDSLIAIAVGGGAYRYRKPETVKAYCDRLHTPGGRSLRISRL
jgi:Mn-containing catalase